MLPRSTVGVPYVRLLITRLGPRGEANAREFDVCFDVLDVSLL